jgi:hypothetical protein
MSQREPEAESVRGGKLFTPAKNWGRVPYYPPELKAHYIDLLRRIKADLSRSGGKPIGWQTIRNMIMEPEDAAIASAEEANRVQRGATQIARSRQDRDAFLTIEHLKAWDKGAALPSDPRCYFIERFLNRLRKDGKLDAVEHVATIARQKYVKDALFSLYRPDVKLSWSGSGSGPLKGLAFDKLRNSAFLIDGVLSGQSFDKVDLILLFGEVDKFIIDVEILLLRRMYGAAVHAVANAVAPEDVQPTTLSLLFNGFMIPFDYLRSDRADEDEPGEYLFASGALLVRNSLEATAADLGLEGRLPAFMQCGADIEVDRGRVDLKFVAGQALSAFASLFPTKADSVLEPTLAQPRTTTRLSEHTTSLIAARDFARPSFG